MDGCRLRLPRPKMISLAYTGTQEKTISGTLALARFTDKRQDTARGELGYRVLNDKSREVFLVQGLDLATTLTDQTQSYLEKKDSPSRRFPNGLRILRGWPPQKQLRKLYSPPISTPSI